jgi:hypothetical protein
VRVRVCVYEREKRDQYIPSVISARAGSMQAGVTKCKRRETI